jgi:hypothetical protein
MQRFTNRSLLLSPERNRLLGVLFGALSAYYQYSKMCLLFRYYADSCPLNMYVTACCTRSHFQPRYPLHDVARAFAVWLGGKESHSICFFSSLQLDHLVGIELRTVETNCLWSENISHNSCGRQAKYKQSIQNTIAATGTHWKLPSKELLNIIEVSLDNQIIQLRAL